DGRELVVVPPTPLGAREPFVVEVEYAGVPDVAEDAAVAGMGVPGVGWWRTDSGVYVVSQCVGAASWFPCNDHPSDKALFTFTITVDAPYLAAANGRLVDERDAGARRTRVFAPRDPLATYLATVDIARFAVECGTGPHGLPLALYHPE